jgi:flagellar basal-body rod protein FlgC
MMEEMVNLIDASRAFEANTVAIRAQKDMANKALAIGRQ